MRACPCCMQKLTPGLLGLGGRRLAGSCERCGDAVCQMCLGPRVLEAGASQKQGRMCRSCLWELLTERGRTPPFPAPPGLRERVARAAREACAHPRVKLWMGFCPDCGDEVDWPAEPGNPVCEECEAPSHPLFNCCWACGESFGEENAPQPTAKGYTLEFDCDAADCEGRVAWLMPFCPWCGEAKRWHSEDDLECGECESHLDRTWAYCVSCGEEAPLPEDCPRCGESLDAADSAARCEECKHLVCGDCFDMRVVPMEPGERLLCSACGAGYERASESSDSPDADEPREQAAPPAEPPPPPPPPSSPWEVLGVAPNTPLPEVRRAYLALVAQYHPDKVAQLGPKLQALAQEETRRLVEAWEQVRKQSR